ncbi:MULTISPECIES: hypothetical protein [Hyphomicrobiales]|jgi:hypothetical protein|uniref:hypothetical protein n=1 Tax=Methylobacterium sp. CCH7-A2 TaxID=1768789 RepID=UPI0008314DE2|nr:MULTISPECIES: hypothetical protein [Hyphomicrobiales]
MSAPSNAEARRFLAVVLADLDEVGIERTAMAIIARASDRTSDPDMIKAVAAIASDPTNMWGDERLPLQAPERSPAP